MRNLDIKELIKNIKITPYSSPLQEFTLLYQKDFEENFTWLSDRVLAKPNSESFNSLSAIFDLIESVESRNILNVKSFYEKSGLSGKEEFLSAYNVRQYEQDEFIKEVLEEIKDLFMVNKSLSQSIKDYVRSYDCYELINRSIYTNFKDPVLKDMLNEFCILEKTEIMTRLEKYIESGWAEFDNPFDDYFKGLCSYREFKDKIYETMGSRFFHGNVNVAPIEQFSKYFLTLNKEKTLGDRIFKLTPSKALDYCLEDTEGNILLGDVFISSLEGKYKKRWFNALKAVKRYSLLNDKKLKYSVSFLTSNPKNTESYEVDFQKDMDFLSLVSTFDTDDMDYEVSCAELLSNCNLIIYGNDSDDLLNNYILNDTPLAINSYAIGAAHNILDRIAREEDLLEDYIILQQLSEALSGLEVMISYDEKLVNDLSLMSYKVNDIASRMNQGELSRSFAVYSDRISSPKLVTNRFQSNLNNYNKAVSTYTKNKDFNKLAIKQNQPAIQTSFRNFSKSLNTFKDYFVKPLGYSSKLSYNKYCPQINSLSYASDHLQLGKKISTKVKSSYSHHPAGHSEEYFIDRFFHYSLECMVYYSKGDIYNYTEILAKLNNHYLKPLIKDQKKFYNLLFSDYQKSNKYNKSIVNFGLTLGLKEDLYKNLQNYNNDFLEKLKYITEEIDNDINNINTAGAKYKIS